MRNPNKDGMAQFVYPGCDHRVEVNDDDHEAIEYLEEHPDCPDCWLDKQGPADGQYADIR